MTKISSDCLTIINVYKSAGADNQRFIKDLISLLPVQTDILILGDFNICYQLETSNAVFATLRNLGFQQLVQSPTHLEGRTIDLVFFLPSRPSSSFEVIQEAQFFTDHDLLTVIPGILIFLIK